MSTKLTVFEALRRAKVEQEQLRIFQQMKEDLGAFENCFLDQANLEYLGVVMGPPLDVDETTGDFNSTGFFRPWVPDEVMRESSMGENHTWIDRYTPELACPEWQYGDIKAIWFEQCLQQLHDWEPNLWDPWKTDPHTIREETGLDLPHYFPVDRPYGKRMYISHCAYFPVDKSIPHVACLLLDSNDALRIGNQVLRSDVDIAIAMVLWRLSEGQHTNHHTKPVRPPPYPPANAMLK